MGGCYSSNCSSRPVQVSTWQKYMQNFIKEWDRALLISAYNNFFSSSNKNGGFIGSLAKTAGLNSISDIPNEFPGMEYEIKFDISVKKAGKEEPTIVNYLDSFTFPTIPEGRFLKDPVNSIATGINRFFGTDQEERLVVITKGNGIYLKEKSEAMQLDSFVIKRSERRYATTLDNAINKVIDICLEPGVSYRGRIRKEKGDAFILDSIDGRIYSFTVTRSHLTKPRANKESQTQRQLEIEYAGYIPGFPGFKKRSEAQLLGNMEDFGRYVGVIYNRFPIGASQWRGKLSLTDERKYDFVLGNTKEAKVLASPKLLESKVNA